MRVNVRSQVNRRGIEKMVQDVKKKVEGKVAMPDLFHEAFMVEHTVFPTVQSMLDASPLANTPIEEMREAMQSPEWSEFVNANTSFPDWPAMLRAAAQAEMERRLATGSTPTGSLEP